MKNKLLYSFQDDLRQRLKDQAFKKAWDEAETEYQLAVQLIEKRLAKNVSQRTLAKQLKTSQALLSRIETMEANPSLSTLKKIAAALGSRLEIRFVD